MTTLREAAEMALEALKQSRPKPCDEDDDYAELAWKKHTAAIDFLRKALDADSMASLPEPVATLWQQSGTGRTRVTLPDSITDCDARWLKVGDLYTAPPAAPVQEPVACQHKKPICDSQGKTLGYSDWKDGKGLAWWPHRSLYTAPPRREWQGLTDEEIWSDGSRMGLSEGGIRRFAREIEAKLKEKNT